MGKAVTDCACPNAQCAMFGKIGKGNIVLHGFLKLKRGRRRRYRCEACGRTFVSSVGTPYHRLKCTRAQFDRVAALSVEGMSKSGIARVMHLSWNTVARWLQRAAEAAERFSDRVLRGYMLTELQADEIRTFIDSKKRVQWVLAAIEVWSRLWVSLVLGRRSYRNVRRLLADAFHRGECGRIPLITTDGNRYYRIVLGRLFGRGCIHGRIVKTFRKGRVSKVERDLSIGSEWQLEEALLYSECVWIISCCQRFGHGGQTGQHQACHCKVYPRLLAARQRLVVLAQSTEFAQPCKRALHHPPPWQHFKAPAGGLVHDLQCPSGLLTQPILETTAVSPVCPQFPQSRPVRQVQRTHQ